MPWVSGNESFECDVCENIYRYKSRQIVAISMPISNN